MPKKVSSDMQLFCKAVLTLKTEKEVRLFFEDVCTSQEIHAITQRMAVAKLLLEEKPYLKIAEDTGSSTATISRVKRTFDQGGEGYLKAFERLNR